MVGVKVLGTLGHRGFVPWAVSPRLPEVQWWLGLQPFPPGRAVPCSKPRCEGLVPTQGRPCLRAPPSRPAQEPPPRGWGLSPELPSPQTSRVPALIPRGAVGAQRGPRAGDSDRLQGQGWRGGSGAPRGSELHGPAGVALQQTNDGRVTLGPSDEFLQREPPCGEGDTVQPPARSRDHPGHPPHPPGAPWGAQHPLAPPGSGHDPFNQRACSSF